MPKTYDKIATQTLGSASASVTFSSIPATYTDLVVVASANSAAANNFFYLQFNGDTSTNYSYTRLFGDGSTAISDRTTNFAAGLVGYVSSTIKTTSIVQIMNYANTTTFKTFISRASNTTVWAAAIVGLWRATPAAINEVKFIMGSSDNTLAGSTFTLYGIKSA